MKTKRGILESNTKPYVGRQGQFDKDAVKKYVVFDKPIWEL